MADKEYIAKISLPVTVEGVESTKTYYIKDEEARSLIADIIAHNMGFVVSKDAATTPLGVTWLDGDTVITGTLAPSAEIHDVYLVPSTRSSGKDVYDEYACARNGAAYVWEKLGDTDITIPELDHFVTDVKLGNSADTVLGAGTTFTAPATSATVTPTSNDFVDTITPSGQKLKTVSITGTGDNVSFLAVDNNTSVTATNTVFDDPIQASLVVPVEKTIHNPTATQTNPIKVNTQAEKTFAIRDDAATPISRISGNQNGELLNSASVNTATETLIIGKTTYSQASVTGTKDTGTVKDYTFVAEPSSKVTTADVTFNAIASHENVNVPVLVSNAAVTATNTSTVSKTAATKAASATVVATGKLAATDANGDTVIYNVASSKSAALTGVTVQTPSHSITVNHVDDVDALTESTITTTFYDGTVTHNEGRN